MKDDGRSKRKGGETRLEEREALKRLKHREEDALAWFIDRYTAYVSTIVSNILGPVAASADLEAIASDVFFAFWTHAKEIRPGKAKAYLGSIARNKAKESTRKTGRELPLEDDMLVISSGTPERELEKREQAAYIRKAVLALREPEREIFLRYYYFYQPVSTIAEEMGLESVGGPGTTAALALLNDAVKKGGVMASSHVGGLSGAFIPVSEDAGMIAAAEAGRLTIEKLEAMTCVCSVGLDMIAIPGDTPVETIAGIIADEMAIGVINNKTTAVRVIPAIGKGVGDCVEYGGLFGRAPIMPVNPNAGTVLAHRGGRFPAPLNSLKN